MPSQQDDDAEMPSEQEDVGADSPLTKLDFGSLTTFPGYLLRRAQLAAYQQLHAMLERHDLRPTQFAVLILLKHNAGARPSDVAAALGLRRTNFVPLIDAMEERDLVVRRIRADDRRARALHLTRKSQRLLSRLEPEVVAHEQNLARLIGADAIDALRRYVEQLKLPD